LITHTELSSQIQIISKGIQRIFQINIYPSSVFLVTIFAQNTNQQQQSINHYFRRRWGYNSLEDYYVENSSSNFINKVSSLLSYYMLPRFTSLVDWYFVQKLISYSLDIFGVNEKKIPFEKKRIISI
jgi:hypothetical protein